MMLRTKLLTLLTLLAAGPLLAIGLIGYRLSLSAVTAQIESQTRLIAEQAARETERRIAAVGVELTLLAENAETERLLDLLALQPAGGPDPVALAAARAAADTFFTAAWSLFAPSYTSIELRDGTDAILHTLGESGAAGLESVAQGRTDPAGAALDVIGHTVHARVSDGAVRGSVRGLVRKERLLPVEALDARFGHRGVNMVTERSTGRLLHFTGPGGSAGDPDGRELEGFSPTVHATSGPVSFGAADARRVGWVSAIDAPPLSIFALADADEFAAPFRRQREALFALVLMMAVLVVPAGAVLLRRATRSLEELTRAADRVGGGDFTPELPPGTDDEVGRLSNAFRAMVSEVSRTLAELERSRQLAAVGVFAAELAHEIRNPLTSIKLNLQRIQRMADGGALPDKANRPIEIALTEIGRMDRVVRSALRLGRAPVPNLRRTLPVDALVDRALELACPELEERGVEVLRSGESSGLVVRGDEEELSGALVNLFLNAAQAMSGGGLLHVRTRRRDAPDASWVDVHVSDTGSGIPDAALKRLFQPFFTTRPEGTGLGLALALRSVENHGGSLVLIGTSPSGTEFRLSLPLAPALVPA
ncbi:hypothetical protein BH23GEM9_BH23GEM9_04480 [soil metagenome]